MILQRFNALVQDQQQPQGNSFLQLQVGQGQQIASVSASAIDGLSQMSARYEQLRSTSDQADNQAQLDTEKFSELNRNLEQVLAQTRSYKTSLRLQSMSELDSDTEDKNALKTQVDSVAAYVSRLRQACADILSHYDERKQRRELDIRALSEARGAIKEDSLKDAQDELGAFAASTDASAAQMLSASAQGLGPQPQQAGFVAPPPRQADLASSLGDLSQMAGSLAATVPAQIPQGSLPPAAMAPVTVGSLPPAAMAPVTLHAPLPAVPQQQQMPRQPPALQPPAQFFQPAGANMQVAGAPMQ